MKRNTIILLVVLAALAVGGFVWWRRRLAGAVLPATPGPQAGFMALSVPGATAPTTTMGGQLLQAVTSLLPTVGAGISSAAMPQSTPKLTTVWSNPAYAGVFKSLV
jgi:hypothetical protein